MKYVAIYNAIIKFGFYLLFILVPLILTPWNYELFEYNKMMVTYGLATIIVGAWVLKMTALKQFSVRKTPLDIPIALFFLSQFISTLFSIDPHVSWFGYYSRFNGGMWSVITYVLLYYAFVTNFQGQSDRGSEKLKVKSEKLKVQLKNQKIEENENYNQVTTMQQYNNVTMLLRIILVTATVVALYGFLERMGIDKHLWVQDVQNRVFSTLGQPNWLAAYLVALLPLAMVFTISKIKNPCLAGRQEKSKIQVKNQKYNTPDIPHRNFFNLFALSISIFYFLVTILFFFVLLCTRSRAGLMGFIIADILFWLLMVILSKQKKSLLGPFSLIHGAFFLIIFFNGSYITQIDNYFTLKSITDRITHPAAPIVQAPPVQTGTLLEYGGTESGKIRKYVWQAAAVAWKSSAKTFLIGTGTETFAWTFFQFRPAGHNLVSEWDFLYNKAHNEYLNYLATTGIFGLGSYLIFLLSVIVYTFLKNQKLKIKSQKDNSKVKNNFEEIQEFSTEISHDKQIISLALFSGWCSILATNFFGFSVVIMQLFLFLFPAILITLQDAQFHISELRTFTFGTGSPNMVYKGTAVLVLVCGLVILYKLTTFWYADTLFATGYRLNRSSIPVQARPLLEQALSFNPAEPLYHDELANTLASFAVMSMENKDASSAMELANESLAQNTIAITTSPANVNFWKTRTKIYYSLSAYDMKFNQAAIEALNQAQELSPNDPKITYNLAILYGRDANNTKAIQLLKDTIELKPNYRDAYYALFVFYTDAKQQEDAKAILSEYLTKVDPNDKDFQELLKK